jgi:small subunit ribosomal protein S20
VANHRQAEKRNRQSIKHQANNRHQRTTMRTLLKKVRVAIAEKSKDKVKTALAEAIPLIDRCAQKGIIPRKRASRVISRLSQTLNTLQS